MPRSVFIYLSRHKVIKFACLLSLAEWGSLSVHFIYLTLYLFLHNDGSARHAIESV